MTEDMTNMPGSQQRPTPNPDLKSLDRLVGTWKLSGDTKGKVTYEWMEGGFFLIQYVDLDQDGQKTKGIEIIGHLLPYGEESSQDIKSRYYDSNGDTLDYVYELNGDTLMIWFGEKDSPAYYKGQVSEDGDTLAGNWVYPGGGGMRRLRPGRRKEGGRKSESGLNKSSC
jgi:hypothetical protein